MQIAIIFNNLEELKDIIYDDSKYYAVLNSIYSAYEGEGISRISSIISIIRKKYIAINSENISNVKKFFKLIDELKKYVLAHSKLNMSDETLNFCLEIIVTDAFIKCKIFVDPEGYINDFAISSKS